MKNVVTNLVACMAAGTALPAVAAPPAQTHKGEAKNILMLVVDDLRPELGCYGEAHMRTPNIDALAADGTVFRQAYVQYAVSAATRASFLTGCYPVTTGVGYPYSVYFVEQFLPSHPSIQRRMCENGFYTRTLGKIHHGLGEDFTEPHFSPKNYGSGYLSPENVALDKNAGPGVRPLTEFLDLPDNDYPDGKVADEAVETIRRAVASGKRFCISAGFLKPHLPFVAPKRYYDLYDERNLPDCPYPDATVDETPYSRSFYNINNFRDGVNGPDNLLSPEMTRRLRHAYFACVSFTDAQIGRIIAELKRCGAYDDTAIILVGDHGWHLADNGMWGKQTNFERATNAPLIVKGAARSGKQPAGSDVLVEFVDIYPTLCDLAGVSTPSFVEGVSFLPVLYDPSISVWKKAAFSEHPRGGFPGGTVDGRTVRTPRYRYVEWSRGGQVLGRELYDHRSDPLETRNIAAANGGVCDEMSALLKKGWRSALPAGVENHADNPAAPKSPGWGPEAAKGKKPEKDPVQELIGESNITHKTIKTSK